MNRSAGRVRAAVTPQALEAVRERAPKNADVLALDENLDLDSVDFIVLDSDDARTRAALPELKRVAVVQVLSAGTDWIEHRLPPHATLCSARGARDAPVAEWILGALLGASTGLLDCARVRRWERRELSELGGWTVLVVGMGSIGRRLVTYLEPLGTTVVGVGSRARERLHGPQELRELLPRADAVVLLAPLTDVTRGLIGRDELAAMRDGTLVVNAARGAVLDNAALLEHVASGRLRAVLDVTDPEPLPAEHPLWRAPGVLSITPHIAGDSPAGHARAAALAGEQLKRWCAGEPLLNVVISGG